MKIKAAKKLIIDIFLKHKLSKKHSNICAEALINAELVGASSHGFSRISSYCNRIKKKLINPKPNMNKEIVRTIHVRR